MRFFLVIVVLAALVVTYSVAPVHADWDPNDPDDLLAAKMHFPQLPDPSGWDVEFLTSDQELADDWVCSETGPVTDVHIWTSWYNDDVALTWIETITVKIYSNDTSGPFNKPGAVLWTRIFSQSDYTMVPYGIGSQGWSNPLQGVSGWEPSNHTQFQQVNIRDISNPFQQQQGTTYWLGVYVLWSNTHNPVGWKTADVSAYPVPYTSMTYSGTAVWWDYLAGVWREIRNPLAANESHDLAFVITSEEAPIPTLGEWGFIFLILLLLGAGVMMVRRWRPATLT